jgi:protein-S-isoprenylcysteine O-methyltransferase Ste14
MSLRWKNVPIPEAHVAGIVLGAILHRTYPKRLFRMGWMGYLLGWPLILLGAALSWWAVLEAGETDISSSKVLLTKGPYARSRNPMYAGWTLGYAGIAFLSNAFWLIVLLPLVVAYTHLVDVQREEEFLEREFGDEYRRYRRRVPRYL